MKRKQQSMQDDDDILRHLQQRFGAGAFLQQHTTDEMLSLWVSRENIVPLIQYLKSELPQPFTFLYDLCGIDERDRTKRAQMPPAAFTVVYHLFSYSRNNFIRLK